MPLSKPSPSSIRGNLVGEVNDLVMELSTFRMVPNGYEGLPSRHHERSGMKVGWDHDGGSDWRRWGGMGAVGG